MVKKVQRSAPAQRPGKVTKAGRQLNAGLDLAKSKFLKSQLVTIFELLSASGLPLKDFAWGLVPDAWPEAGFAPRLEHRPSGFYCDFYFHPDGVTRAVRFSPGASTLVDSSGSVNWELQKALVKTWLSYLKREIEAPDVWDMLLQENYFIDSASDAVEDNSPFTSQEQAQVISKLRELNNYLLTAHRLDPELVEARLQYLEGAVGRVGRLDWKNLLLSTIIGILLNASVSPEIVHEVMRYVPVLFREILIYQLNH